MVQTNAGEIHLSAKDVVFDGEAGAWGCLRVCARALPLEEDQGCAGPAHPQPRLRARAGLGACARGVWRTCAQAAARAAPEPTHPPCRPTPPTVDGDGANHSISAILSKVRGTPTARGRCAHGHRRPATPTARVPCARAGVASVAGARPTLLRTAPRSAQPHGHAHASRQKKQSSLLVGGADPAPSFRVAAVARAPVLRRTRCTPDGGKRRHQQRPN